MPLAHPGGREYLLQVAISSLEGQNLSEDRLMKSVATCEVFLHPRRLCFQEPDRQQHYRQRPQDQFGLLKPSGQIPG